MQQLSTLQLAPIDRTGGSSEGASWKERWTYDFVVDGRSLADLLGASEGDRVGRLDRDDREGNAQSIRVLTGEAAGDFGPDRVMLFVCPECADLGCGAITAALRSNGDGFQWSDFKYENSYDPSMTTNFPAVGPFTFAAGAYRRALAEVAAR
jgi:hypothetical protein